MKHEALPEGATVIRWETSPPPPDASTGEKFPWREQWGAGEWEAEPKAIAQHQARQRRARRAPLDEVGAWCGYVGLPPGHALHGHDCTSWDDGPHSRLDAHGGITYSRECQGEICHAPQPGEPEHVWWVGFDTSHSGDLAPGLNATVRAVCDPTRLLDEYETYRDVGYVIGEVERLAAQLEEVGGQ